MADQRQIRARARRQEIMSMSAAAPLPSQKVLADKFKVSLQVIGNDIAVLRANGVELRFPGPIRIPSHIRVKIRSHFRRGRALAEISSIYDIPVSDLETITATWKVDLKPELDTGRHTFEVRTKRLIRRVTADTPERAKALALRGRSGVRKSTMGFVA